MLSDQSGGTQEVVFWERAGSALRSLIPGLLTLEGVAAIIMGDHKMRFKVSFFLNQGIRSNQQE